MLQRLAIGSLVVLLATVRLAAAAVTDNFVGDPGTAYINIEFSPDGKYAAFLEGTATSWGIAYTGWLAQVDQATGNLVPANGKGHALGSSKLVGVTQFGTDNQGNYLVMLNEEGRIVRIRPNGANPPTIDTVADNTIPETLEKRAFPFLSRNAGSPLQYVTYQVRDEAAGMISQYLVELVSDSANHVLLFSEPYPTDGSQPAAIKSFARWLPGEFLLTHGAYENGCGSPCLTQLKTVQLPTAVYSYVTTDNRDKIDAFPFVSSSNLFSVVSGINGTAQGGLYTYDVAAQLLVYDRDITFDNAQSGLLTPGIAQSFEPFAWGGEDYAVYEAVDTAWTPVNKNLARAYPGEIWVAKLGPPYSTCRVSTVDYPNDPMIPVKRARVDAEALLYDGGNRVALYYHSAIPKDQEEWLGGDLRRIDLGTKADFDSRCQTGTAYPAGDYESPTVPGGLVAAPASTSRINLSWNASTDNVGVAGYKVYRNGVLAGIATTRSYSDSGLTPSTSYAYTVAAYDAQGNTSANSAAVNASTRDDTTPPSVPVGLIATALSSQISLSWNPSTDDVRVIHYKILRCYNPTNCTPATRVGSPTSTSFIDSNVMIGVAYRYTVSAVDAKGNTSAPSVVATAKIPDTIPPSVPTGLTAAAVSFRRIDLSWTASTDNVGVTSYRVERCLGATCTNFTEVATRTGTSFPSNGLAANTTYRYRVRAVDAAMNFSSYSTIVVATTPRR
jgi:fibronectin type 3 domain-containing protein